MQAMEFWTGCPTIVTMCALWSRVMAPNSSCPGSTEPEGADCLIMLQILVLTPTNLHSVWSSDVSMWIWTRKPGRSGNVWIILGRQMVNTWEVMSNEEYEALSCNIHLWAGSQSVAWQHQYHSLFTMPGMSQQLVWLGTTCPLCVYYTLCHCTWPDHQIIRG